MRQTYFCCLFIFIIINIYHISAEECNDSLLEDADVSASSSVSGRGPNKASLRGSGAWSSGSSDFNQFLKVDFGSLKNVTFIATQGRENTMEYIEEFSIQYGSNDLDYADYRDINGDVMLFKGNVDGNSIKTNYFETPIIARYIKINPTGWVERISLRVELYGCDYVADTISFRGDGLIKKSLIGDEISSVYDDIRLRMKTNYEDGIILYSKGSQQDVLALQLKDNKMILNYQLGGDSPLTSLSVGSLLDDNLWHDIIVQRYKKFVTFSVDRVEVTAEIQSDYEYLNLNREIYIGGIPNFNNDGILVKRNYSGCMENVFINNWNIVRSLKRDDSSFHKTRVVFSCAREQVTPITFKTGKAFIEVKGYQNPSFNISFDFRTFEENGALLYHKFYTTGFVKLYLEKGKLVMIIEDKESSNRLDTMFDAKMNDGQWKRTAVAVSRNRIEVVVNGLPSVTKRIFYMESGPFFYVGGNMPKYVGFRGCMRNILVESNKIHPDALMGSNSPANLMVGACQMVDRCSPSPCKNEGSCSQSWSSFKCDCTGTGYTGAVCGTSTNPLSCKDFGIYNPGITEVDLNIDVDGSGPLKPFPVKCKFLSDGRTETYISHNSLEPTSVNGFDTRGSFIQNVEYVGGIDEITQIVNRSYSCKQYIKYKCFNAQLFGMSDQFDGPFRPFSWWVSRDNRMMDYWGGSRSGTRRCGCGMDADCTDPRKWCNCDSTSSEWKFDEGYLREKEDLPVTKLRIGDTGSLNDDKRAEFTLGPLVCEEDKLFDNIVTFRKQDGYIRIPKVDFSYESDIYFQFKTTAERGTFFYSRGSPDKIKLELNSGKQIQFIFEGANGPIGLNVDSPFALNDNQWHSILVIRNRKEARIHIDGGNSGNGKGDTLIPPGAAKSLTLTEPLYIGSNDIGKDGFVGCMRALLFNGRMVDMKQQAERGIYGVSPGCIGKCDSSPCLNNGTCNEAYSSYTCDCRWTEFKGPICADEVGAYLKRGHFIEYNFTTTLNTIEEDIRIGFLTTNPKGLLFSLISKTGDYFNLILSSSGHLKIIFKYGLDRLERVVDTWNLANAQHHDIRIKRTEKGTKLSVYVDNYEPHVFTFPITGNQDNQFNDLQSIYLGGNRQMSPGNMFEGCISRVKFNDFYILNLLYQENKPANIMALPNPITQNDCEIEPVTHPPELAETNTRPYSDVDITANESSSSAVGEASIIYGAVLAVLFILLILILILIGRYVSRQKGEYKTHEDSGSKNAPDADTAILHGQTGHGVNKNHEYFI